MNNSLGIFEKICIKIRSNAEQSSAAGMERFEVSLYSAKFGNSCGSVIYNTDQIYR